MKSIKESIFNDNDVIKDIDDNIVSIIKDFLYNNYDNDNNNQYDIKYDNKKKKYIVSADAFIIVKRNIKRNIKKLTNEYFIWGETTSFDCSNCLNLETLDGAPSNVRISFNCSRCSSLKSLEGAPRETKKFFCVECEDLNTLEGAPERVKEKFVCSYCFNLKSLKGAPLYLDTLDCSGCSEISRLDWKPKSIKTICIKGTRLTPNDFNKLNMNINIDQTNMMI